ncbi:hypothetical protein CDL12_29074 [Handroanthus impetiginosus]|uniref:Uncharacterized protein n=1 Tax=Handroanthus impetiginosus TaxID=429701 RepID=A0A2G9FZG4_9LAMI|nr:hypothetical protein CDL12_29074 [Handroanthus impetiginosus]
MIRASSSSSSSSSRKSRNGGESDTDNLKKMKVLEPHLSGAYIRSLVKELTSSRTKDSSKTSKEKLMICTPQDGFSDRQEKSHQHKRKVRRRVQTRRPYQERLLNMAEARREIVSALKLHREAMKLKQQMKSGQEIQPFEPASHQFCLGQEAPNSSITRNNFFYSPCPWAAPDLDSVLPRQTLGLNLNLQYFYNLSTDLSSMYSSSSVSNSSSPVLSSTDEEISHTTAVSPPPMAEAVEFGDHDRNLNLVSSNEDFVSSTFDEVMEFPGWLNANGGCLEHVEDLCFNKDYFGDYALPCYV